ncbi:MAG: PASTA domain-containing protein [Tissierellia bacterium]|nr:PASTA domain-containing protein [Tissierellia bacterium]
MDNKDKNKGYGTNKKILIFISFIAFFVLLYIIILVRLQIFDVNSYKSKAEKVIVNKDVIYPDRGAIYDRNRKPLAANLQFNTAYISVALPRAEKQKLLAELQTLDKSDVNSLALVEKYETRTSLPDYSFDEVEDLASILGINTNDLLHMLENEISGQIASKVPKDKKQEVEKLGLPYIYFRTESERYYPNQEILSSTLGYVENGVGAYGLERYYDEILAGKKGYEEFFKAIGGTTLAFESGENIPSEKAKNLVTTIDEDYQKILYDNLLQYFKDQTPMYGAAILTDPNTGEVLAMESLPSYNPNSPRSLNSDIDKLFLNAIDQNDKDSYMIRRWNNINVSSVYEPGSTFKAITTAIGLDQNHEIEHNEYTCNGYIEISPGVTIKCWRAHNPHGVQSLREAFSNSCNPAFVGIIDDIGKEKFVESTRSFKFGELTGIDLPNEVAGVFNATKEVKNVDFRPMSYGHSISTTPIQQISALNATINGGIYYRPHLIKEILDEQNNLVAQAKPQEVARVLSEKSSATMREYFEYNAQQTSALKSNEIRMGVKTGTTELVSASSVFLDKDNEFPNKTIVSIFATFPSNAPKYSLLILFSETQRDALGSSLYPVTRNIFEEIDKLNNNRASTEIGVGDFIRIPNLVELPVYKARQITEQEQLELKLSEGSVSEFSIIKTQMPQANGFMERKGFIEVFTDYNSQFEVPNIIDMKLEDAQKLLTEDGINFETTNKDGIVIKQKPDAGTIINKNEKIVITTDEQ